MAMRLVLLHPNLCLIFCGIRWQFERKVTLDEIYEVLGSAPGVQVVDDRAANQHPEPLLASNQENILVGRVRYDNTQGTPEDGYTGIEVSHRCAALFLLRLDLYLVHLQHAVRLTFAA
jgi:hypothetical protein